MKLETPRGIIKIKKLRHSTYRYSLGGIELGFEITGIENVSNSLKNFLEGVSRLNLNGKNIFYDRQDGTYSREIFYLAGSHVDLHFLVTTFLQIIFAAYEKGIVHY